MKILVTGASGFVGSALCELLVQQGHNVRAVTRKAPSISYSNIEFCLIQEIDQADWSTIVQNVDVIIHLAARVHQMNAADDAEAEYFRVNVLGTERILDAALVAGVKRVVFLSSIKVNGEESSSSGFTELDEPKPQDFYALSKWQAEQLVAQKTQGQNLEFVILRTPLVYGKGVKANFENLFKLVKLGVPLPLGLVRNRRSFIYLNNLTSALLLASIHPKANGKTYFVADSEIVSTAELISEMASAFGKSPPWLLPVPPYLLKLMAKCLNKESVVQRLFGNLVVDASLIREELGWSPAFSLSQGLRRTLEK